MTTHGQGVELAIEAVGRPELWELAVALTRKGGQAILFGGCEPGTSVSFETKVLHYGERKLIGVFHHTPIPSVVLWGLLPRGSCSSIP